MSVMLFDAHTSNSHHDLTPRAVANPFGVRQRMSCMGQLSDDALLAGYGAGDAVSSVAFVRRFQARVFGIAVAVLQDAQAAEDAAQEAFVRAWRHAGSYDPRRGGVASWLAAIARNAAIDAHRARQSRPADLGDLPARLAAHDRPPDELVAYADEVARVREALARLPVEQRRAVMLAAYGGRSAREVSEADGIPLGTAKTRIRAGLQGVRRHLEPTETQR